MRKIFVFTVIMLMFIVNVCSAMQIKMLNIGHGDAILIKTDNKNILIDTADASERDKLERELARANVDKIDTLILSHAHADHIGNANFVIRKYGVNAVYDNGYASTSRYYRNYVKAIKELQCEYRKLERGDILTVDDGVKIEVVYPADEYDIDAVNNQSLVFRLEYGEYSILFTGDIEIPAETEILYGKLDIASNMLKAAHHGSRTSSAYNFVEAVNPAYVIISAGDKYGHPHVDSIMTYLKFGIPAEKIMCTSFNGTITIDTDGVKYTVTPDVKNNWVNEYVANKRGYITRVRRI